VARAANNVRIQRNRIRTTDQLIGLYFEVERDEAAYAARLREMGIAEQFANACAYCVNYKLSGV
jgi:hypothetical protein